MAKNYLNEWQGLFLQHRPFLMGYAFRMTGSLSEAEDLVQDTFIECAKTDPSEIDQPKSWLTKICSNKGLDHLKLAYKKRETYPGTWLPDAIPESLQIWSALSEGASPEASLALADSLTTTFLLLVEKLSPEERVVYLLNEVFEYSFKEIAEFLNKSEGACRKTAERARKAISAEHPRFSTASPDAGKVIAEFFEVAKTGDRRKLTELLAEESEFWADGGGKVPAAFAVLSDREKIAHFFASVSKTFKPDSKLEGTRVNSRPGLVLSKQVAPGVWAYETIFTFEFRDGKIARIFAQRNPDKLEALSRSK